MLGSTDLSAASICFDSRKVDKGSLFVAVKELQVDGHEFIDIAVQQGAAAILVEEFPSETKEHITYIKVKDSSLVLGLVAANFYDNPSEKLKLVAVTGTNGKTTVVTLLHQLYLSMGKSVGLLSTIVNKIGDEEIVSTHTTPDAIALNSLLSEMVAAGCEYCFIEASSHAIHQNRTGGLHFCRSAFHQHFSRPFRLSQNI